MAVNGGGGVTLQFQRSPLKATTRTIHLPWNQIVVIEPVVMMPYGGSGISWDQEDTSLKVGSHFVRSRSISIQNVVFSGEVFQALFRPRLRQDEASGFVLIQSKPVVCLLEPI